jgi:sarcosine oxidase subunit beta
VIDDLPNIADTVIIGGGIMGASIAWQISQRLPGSTVVLERDLIAAGASGRTGALLRQHYTNIPEATLASRSLTIFREWSAVVGGSCGFTESGLIVTIPTLDGFEDNTPRLEHVTRQLQSIGVAIELVDAGQLAEIDPAARFDDIGLATYEPKSGYVDAIAATRSMAQAAAQAGATVCEGVGAVELVASASKIIGVRTTHGVIATERVMIAAGPWSTSLADGIGIDLPISTQRVQVAIFQTPATMPASARSYVDNVAAVFCRPWGVGRTMVGLGGGEVHDEVDPDDFEHRNNPSFVELAKTSMAQRFPGFPQAKYLHGHAGLYDMTPDGHPIIGPTGLDGLWIAAGFSGAGFKKGPAVGMMIAGALAGDPDEQSLLGHFRLDRDWTTPWSAFEYRLAHDFGHGF